MNAHVDVTAKRDGALRVLVVRCGESWTRYVTLARPIARAEWRDAWDRWVAPVTGQSSYSPTGRAFWSPPRVIRRRRVVCIAQSGGLDV